MAGRLACVAALLAVVTCPQTARAECAITSPELMYLGDNATYDLSIALDPTDQCNINLEPRGEGVAFHSLTVAKAPEGSLTEAGNFTYHFALRAGAKSDSFALKLCGTDIKGSGCSELRYTANMR